MSIVVSVFVASLGIFCVAAGRWIERRNSRRQIRLLAETVVLARQRLDTQQIVEAELLDIVNQQRHLLRLLVRATDEHRHPALRNHDFVVQWIADKARKTLL